MLIFNKQIKNAILCLNKIQGKQGSNIYCVVDTPKLVVSLKDCKSSPVNKNSIQKQKLRFKLKQRTVTRTIQDVIYFIYVLRIPNNLKQ